MPKNVYLDLSSIAYVNRVVIFIYISNEIYNVTLKYNRIEIDKTLIKMPASTLVLILTNHSIGFRGNNLPNASQIFYPRMISP